MKFVNSFAVMALLCTPLVAQAQSPAVDAAREATENYDREGAKAILVAACDEGDALACRSLMAVLERSYEDGDDKAARAIAAQLCAQGDPLGCMTLARYAGDGDGGDIDQPLQRSSLLAACEAGLASGCNGAARMAKDGEGGAQDEALAEDLFLKGCDGGSIPACQMLADIQVERGYQAANDAEKDAHWTKARATHSRACDMGDRYSCTSLADMMFKGEGGPADQAGALALLESACSADYYQCREWLGQLRP